jgi:hypothetical protein
MCHIVAVNDLTTGAMPCLGHSGEVVNPEADAGIALNRLAIETEEEHDRQLVEPFAAREGGPAVEESLVAIARFELQQPMRVCSMKGMLYGASSIAEVLCMLLRIMGSRGGAKVGVAKMQVGPGSAGGAVQGSKVAVGA